MSTSLLQNADKEMNRLVQKQKLLQYTVGNKLLPRTARPFLDFPSHVALWVLEKKNNTVEN